MRKTLIKVIDFFIRAILILIPLDKKLIILEGNKNYDDNTRALFEFMLRARVNKSFKFVWFVDNPQNYRYLESIENVKIKKIAKFFDIIKNPKVFLEFLYYNSAAGLCIFSNSLFGYNVHKNQRRIYLGHGLGFKNVRGKMGSSSGYKVIISMSSLHNKLFTKVWPDCADKLIITGYPRNDFLFKTPDSVKEYFKHYTKMKKIIWMPTFKRGLGGKRNDFMCERDCDIGLISEDFIKNINKVLEENNCLLVIKLHPFQDLNYVQCFNKCNIITLSREDIEKIGCATYEFVSIFDAMITDFSSAVYDYLLLDKPVAFDLSDIEAYKNGIGFLVENVEYYMPGEKIYCANDFIRFIKNVCLGNDSYADERRKIRDIMHHYKDNNSSERVYKTVARFFHALEK